MKTIDGKIMAICFKKGTEVLLSHIEELNALNVFPVPDGDTGSNMASAMLEASKNLDALDGKMDLQSVLEAIESGTLLGARGNSGVILSQIFRGFRQGTKGKKILKAEDFAQALKSAREVSYSAVMKPVEGTMLTVIRILSTEADKYITEDMTEFMERLWKRSTEVVNETPKYLKKLRDAGVVDAGAKGFSYIMEGFYRVLNGETKVDLNVESITTGEIVKIAQEDLKYLYCTEVMVKTTKDVDIDELRKFYNTIGDSLILVNSSGLLKLHVHTNTPGVAIDKALEYGELYKSKIDNMKTQHHQIISAEEGKVSNEPKEYGIIVIADGPGFESIFKSLGVDVVLNGGQSSNPTTAQIKEAVDSINAKFVFVFPNNPNIIMSANSVKEMTNGKKVIVVNTATIQQGLAALFAFNSQQGVLENEKNFQEAIASVKSIEITRAVRDTQFKNLEVKKDQYISLIDGKIVASADLMDDAIFSALEKAGVENAEVITIFYGKDVSEDEANVFFKECQIRYPSVDIELYYGGQPYYYYLISVE
ncbi:DAK2 domain-containing protein [Athalassotoga saccharophila]|uniref:DAK2 domain-containing protein n=1 Tax=Athalassotoga saccharophila TaxID=1441386 RepID=UPI00137B85F5|nr:DAK2 domain-containing protein [Athalassotoga saccharophila]BBJ28058.1 dihydroxyacetone kinase-like protein [Athalassotoga saccharophila]